MSTCTCMLKLNFINIHKKHKHCNKVKRSLKTDIHVRMQEQSLTGGSNSGENLLRVFGSCDCPKGIHG